MSKVKNPAEKKHLAYEHDHYNRAGQHDKAWRKVKPRKKAKARRDYRKDSNESLRISILEEAAPASARRKLGGLKQRRVIDYGVMVLKDFVEDRKIGREARVGAKKKRRTARAR